MNAAEGRPDYPYKTSKTHVKNTLPKGRSCSNHESSGPRDILYTQAHNRLYKKSAHISSEENVWSLADHEFHRFGMHLRLNGKNVRHATTEATSARTMDAPMPLSPAKMEA